MTIEFPFDAILGMNASKMTALYDESGTTIENRQFATIMYRDGSTPLTSNNNVYNLMYFSADDVLSVKTSSLSLLYQDVANKSYSDNFEKITLKWSDVTSENATTSSLVQPYFTYLSAYQVYRDSSSDMYPKFNRCIIKADLAEDVEYAWM